MMAAPGQYGSPGPAVRPGPADRQRLMRFREEHPEVEIVAHGYWQALIPGPDGETVITRWDLDEFLERLDSLFASQSPAEDDR